MAPKSSGYWQQRFNLLQEAQLKKGQEYYYELEKQYIKASNSIEKEIAVWYQRFADNNQITLLDAKKLLNSKELKEFRWTVEEYIKYGQENAINQQWMTQLENASARVHISRLEALKLQLQQQVEVLYGNQTDGIDKLAKSIYADGYYHSAFEIQKGFNLGWSLQALNDKQIEAVISKPWTNDGLTFKDRCWTNKTQLVNAVHTQLTQTIMRGDAPDKAIKNIAKQFDVSKNKAGRLVMTESAFFASNSQKDCFNDLFVERYEIVATLDMHTSEMCQELDGKIFDMKDYESGVTAPPFHCWCRTVTVPSFDDNYTERVARSVDGKTYYVSSDMKYKDWYAKTIKDNPGAEVAFKKQKNLVTDKEQYKKYKATLGEESLGSFDKFQDLKYNNSETYKALSKDYESKKQADWQRKVIDENSNINGYKILNDSSSIPQWAADQANHWTDEEKEALTYYTSHEYSSINGSLRSKDKPSTFIQDKIDKISSAIDRAGIEENIVAWRGTHLSNFTQSEWLKATSIEQWVNRTIDDKAFSSSSLLRGSAFTGQQVFMQILVPKGSKGAYINPISEFKEEYELLFQKGSIFKIVDTQQQGGKIFIKVIYEGVDES